MNVAFSENGFSSNNYFTVSQDTSDRTNMMTQRMELKVTKLYLSGTSGQVDVIAGLTGIASGSLPDNWAGTPGVG